MIQSTLSPYSATKASLLPRFGVGNSAVRMKASPKNDPRTLISLDYDGTLSRHLPSVTKLAETHRDRFVLHMNTGRTLSSVQSIAPQLTLPLQFLSLMNGSMLFENLRGQATPEWLGGLCEEDEQPEWRAQVFQETGWQAPKTAHIVNEVLNAEFTENPKTLPTGKVVKLVRPWPNEPEYRLEGSPETVASFGQALSNRIILSLQKSGIQAHCDTEDKKNGSRELQTRCYSFMPARRDKASPVRFLINALPGIQKLVTAGNAENDLPMLLPTHIENKPNHPLLCGLNPSMLAQVTLKGHGTSVDQQSNDLAQEIWQTIKPSTKTSAKSDRVRGCLRSTTN